MRVSLSSKRTISTRLRVSHYTNGGQTSLFLLLTTSSHQKLDCSKGSSNIQNPFKLPSIIYEGILIVSTPSVVHFLKEQFKQLQQRAVETLSSFKWWWFIICNPQRASKWRRVLWLAIHSIGLLRPSLPSSNIFKSVNLVSKQKASSTAH